MPRAKKTIRPVGKHICFPEDVVARVDLELYSPLEGRVPFGAWQEFLTELIRQYFAVRDAQPGKSGAGL